MRQVTALLAAAVALAGCSSGTRLRDRVGPRAPCPPPVVTPGGWNHTRSAGLAAVMRPRHVANDAVVAADQAITVHGKLGYGPISKDLEDESVALWVEDGACHATEVARATTNDDGRVQFTIPGRAAGQYQFWLAVVGDGTVAPGTAYVVAPGQPAVVFDVDGTLTRDDKELLEELVGAGPAEMFPDANAVARAWADHGELVIYLTGRAYPLRAMTQRWLAMHEFPPGPLITTDHLRDSLPGETHVGRFKTALVTSLLATGLTVVRAYGNASTDVCAYARAGVAPDRTFIVGPEPRRCDDHPVTVPLDGYTEHLRELGSTLSAR